MMPNHFMTFFASPALYLDPGSGSFLIQLLLAALLGIGVAAKMYWYKIKSLFRGKKAQDSQPESLVNEDDDEA